MAEKAKPAPKAAPAGVRLADHPRVAAAVAQAKGWGGLSGLALVAWASWRAGVPAFDTGVRALLGGLAGYLAAWAIAVTVGRHVIEAQISAAYARHLARRAEGTSAEQP